MTLIESLRNQKVKVTISLFGQHIILPAVISKYEKPFIEMQVGKITRIFNENAVKEIIKIGD
jgi:hypothetical protein